MIHDDCVLMLAPTLQFVRDGSDVLLAPPTNWTRVTETNFSGNPQWGHWPVWHGRYAAMLYLGDPRVLPFMYLLERWAFAWADHFVVALNGPHTEDIFEQLVIASEKRIFLELAVPTILALLSARPAFVPVVQGTHDGRQDSTQQAQDCLDSFLPASAAHRKGGSGGGDSRGAFACHPIKLKDHVGVLSNMIVRDLQLAALLESS
eukprot:Tamp_10404.p1 GENE.Tamp_10404~~Tamp_10404.p1  ORF type:complete len:205 (+),score=25.41 Tamp_10404:632-1246(+)